MYVQDMERIRYIIYISKKNMLIEKLFGADKSHFTQ
jgi:hypothetical protein